MTPERWLCIYSSRTGTTAHAVFATQQEAIRFAERHCQASQPSGFPMKWQDAGGASVLSTVLGDYLITAEVRRNT